MSLSKIRGITWNHSRAFPPLIAAAQRFGEANPGIDVVWEKRSLHEFGHASLAGLCAQYDLIVVDHPMMGEAHRDKLLVDLKPLLRPELLAEMATDSLGESYRSYVVEEHLYALPIDAAAPAASSRTDLLERLGIAAPESWQQVLELARRGLVRMPGFPADLFLNFIGMCVSQGAVIAASSTILVDREIALACFDLLHELAGYMPDEIYDWNPIALYEHMTATDEFSYCPFAYTYSNYSRSGFAKHNLRFLPSPALPNGRPMRTVLGGTGIALSQSSPQREPALAFAEYVQSAMCQKTLYGLAGGQPARRSAWADPALNIISSDFFRQTLPSLEMACVRPRYAGYVPFQERAGGPLAQYFRAHRSCGSKEEAGQTLDRIEALYRASIRGRSMPEFSCTDFTFPLLTRAQTLSLLQLLDFRYVDLGLFERNAHVQTSAMLAAPAQFAIALAEDLRRANLRASDLFLQIGDDPRHASTNDPDDRVRMQNRETFKRSLELCSTLQCGHMTGLPGVHHDHPSRDFACAVDETQWRVDECRASGITYAIEPHIGSICEDIESTIKLLDAVSDLTLTLDYGHFIASGHSSQEVHALLPNASHLHLRGGAPRRLQTAMQENTIDFNGALERLRELNFTGALALEYVWIDWEGCNRSDTLSETLLLRQLISTIADSLHWKAG